MQRGRLWKRLAELHDEYGATIRIGPHELSTISPAVWQDLYTTPRPTLRKDPYSQAAPLNGAHSLFTAEGATHRRMKRVMINVISDKALQGYSNVIESHSSRLVERLQSEAHQSHDGNIDICKHFGDTALDLISELAVGEPFVDVDPGDGNNHAEILSFFRHAKFSTLMNSWSRWPILQKAFVFGYAKLGAKSRLRTWKICIAKLQRRLERAHSDSTFRMDFVSHLDNKVRAEDGKSISAQEVDSNIIALILADSLLTTVAITTCTYLLARDRQSCVQLKEELHHEFNDLREITVQSTQNLPFLNAVLNETLRLQHPTPITLPRVLDEDCVIGDELFPAKSTVGTHLQVIQTSSRHWVDPQEFRPVRFLPEGDVRYDPRFARDNKSTFQPFSTGPRKCIGAKLFLSQARVILAKLFWGFNVELTDPMDRSWLDQQAYLIFEPQSLNVKLRLASDGGLEA
ncbi:MAG: hypothetical protein M1828_002454 [Chrysothrix sp. TS-e1954]|nr:MAG: hypothetical protein M1828_002454 [Chrysothrix sp. TS-e1954]